jgi:two-component system KDP operon response regulator KdpE
MSEADPLVLVIDDEPQLCRYLRTVLSTSGYRVLEATTAAEGESLAASHRPDLILLDLGLPDMDGIHLTHKLREWCTVPILILSARGREHDKIQALDAGADDYLTKPFGTGELQARIRVALRHRARALGELEPTVFETKRWSLDPVKREVCVEGRPVHLTPNEYRLLLTLVQHAGKVLTHKQLLKAVWGECVSAQTHYLRVYMAQLRHKLEQDPAQPKYFITEAGVGYRLREE